MNRGLLLLLSCLASACAGQIAPSGGPPDATPPEIIAAVPSPGTIGFTGREFHLEFSEYVDRRSVEESLFLSPPLGRLEFDWSGTEVTVRFPDSLRPGTTYIMTIGTDVKDMRERGNRMSASFALPFSTGDHIDSAAIAGRVFDPSPGGVMIFAYDLAARSSDSLDPGKLRPDFVTQTGKDGSFRLPYLPFGEYRLIAVGDEYKNLLYDRQIDRYGLTTRDVRLSADSSVVSGIRFRMAKEDTAAPFLSSARAPDRVHLLARFSEAMDTAGMHPGAFLVVDTVTGASLSVAVAAFVDSARLDVQLVTAAQESAGVYRVSARGVRDASGNLLAAGSPSAVVSASTRPDTTRPEMTGPFPADSARGVPFSVRLLFSWTEPIRTSAFDGGVRLSDSAGTPVPADLRWNGAMSAQLYPARPFDLNARYTLRVVMDSVIDASGNSYRDSVLVRHFQIGDDRHRSSIAGRVEDRSSDGTKGRIHVIAREVATGEKRTYEVALDSAGLFELRDVGEGRYGFFLFRDADGNGVYSPGFPHPFSAAEAFAEHPDTIKVRARWPVEGLVLRINGR